MSAPVSAAPARPGRVGLGRARLALSGRPAWVVLVLVVAVALAYGSVRPATPSAAARVSYLESVIKCPECEDLSIAQSSAAEARSLRSDVRAEVAAGWSNGRIEAAVVAEYGSAELLRPTSPVVWVVPIVAVLLGAAGIAVVFARRARRGARPETTPEDEALVRRALEEAIGR